MYGRRGFAFWWGGHPGVCRSLPESGWYDRRTANNQNERYCRRTGNAGLRRTDSPRNAVCALRVGVGAPLTKHGAAKRGPSRCGWGVSARASVSRADWKNRASSLCMWVSRSDPGTGFVRSRQRFAHRSHVGLIEREAPSCESCGWCATGGAQKSRFGRGRGPRMDSKMPARDPQAAYTYVALHSVQVHWSDRRPRAGLRGVEMRTPRRGAPPTGFRTSVWDVGGRVAEAQFLLC